MRAAGFSVTALSTAWCTMELASSALLEGPTVVPPATVETTPCAQAASSRRAWSESA